MEASLPSNCKFAVLAIADVRSDVPPDFALPDGTRVFTTFPIELDAKWQSWLGLDFSRIDDSNLVLVLTADAGFPIEQLSISDSTNVALAGRLADIFSMLRLRGTIEYQKAFLLTGHTKDGQTVCQNFSELVRYNITRGCLPWMIRDADLAAAVTMSGCKKVFLSNFVEIHKSRLGRGWLALNSALQQYYASDRIHGFVRSVEAIIAPEIGSTTKNFIHRCSLFAAPSSQQNAARDVLTEAYEMRCDVEHVHHWDRYLSKYPTSDREDIAFWRTRQMETLACMAYSRILSDQVLQQNFLDDNAIAAFWAKPDHQIRAAFGQVCNVIDLKIVTKYDAATRAHPSEYPAGWFETLHRQHPLAEPAKRARANT